MLQRLVGGVEVRCAQCCARADCWPLALCCCGADCWALGYVLAYFKNPNVTKQVPPKIIVRERAVENISGNFVAITMAQVWLWEKAPREPHFADVLSSPVKVKSAAMKSDHRCYLCFWS